MKIILEDLMATQKKVLGIRQSGSTHWVGDGFHVRNLFPSNGIEDEISPFLMLDYAGPTRVAPTANPRGVGEHPHRGFETVTIAYQGAVEHRDSAGHAGSIFPGDVQWMTAASGVVHEEMHEREFAKKGGIFEMVQLWVNLPKAHKMSKPRYQGLTHENIPLVQLGDAGYARVIAGELNGTPGPAKTFTPVNVFDLRLKAGTKTELALPVGHNAAVVLLKGDVLLNSADELKGEAKIAWLSSDGDRITLEIKDDTVLLVLSGEPIREPVMSYGPFVMNTREEILQAVADYQAGKMGHLEAPVAQ
jgi:redox-sensitive bicupin YhaK (pirin superfamily)